MTVRTSAAVGGVSETEVTSLGLRLEAATRDFILLLRGKEGQRSNMRVGGMRRKTSHVGDPQ